METEKVFIVLYITIMIFIFLSCILLYINIKQQKKLDLQKGLLLFKDRQLDEKDYTIKKKNIILYTNEKIINLNEKAIAIHRTYLNLCFIKLNKLNDIAKRELYQKASKKKK